MKKRVLIIDDEVELLEVMKKRLESCGLEVLTASDGESAIHIMKNDELDLIVLDVIMPIMDGFSVFQWIKDTPVVCNIPVIMLSGRSAMAETFRAMGADGFLTKPMEASLLVSEVNRLLKNRALLLCEEPQVIDDITKAFEEYDYEVCTVADEELMLKKGKEDKYKCIVAHLASIKTPPEQFGAAVNNLLNYKGPQLIVYSDATVEGLEDNDAAAIEEVVNKWKRVGSGIFYDSRTVSQPFSMLFKEWVS